MKASPLGAERRRILVELTHHWLEQAQIHVGRPLAQPRIRFDLTGRAAGQYLGRPPTIRYNPWIAAAQFEEFCRQTPPHEVAHHVVSQLHPGERLPPHGEQWRRVMAAFGVPASTCHHYALDGVPVRRQRRFAYGCACGTHWLTTTRHNRVRRGTVYLCRRCGQALKALSPEAEDRA